MIENKARKVDKEFLERERAYRQTLPRDLLWIEDLITSGVTSGTLTPHGVLSVPALPYPHDTAWQRIRCAWRVLNGRARAVQWPKHRERVGLPAHLAKARIMRAEDATKGEQQ